MARCSSNDGKFVSFDETTVEVESEDVADGELQTSVRVVRPCSGCGQDQATTTLEFEVAFEHECTDEVAAGADFDPETKLNNETIDDRTYSIDGSVEAEPVDDYATKDRHGKPITNSRYQRHLIGASISATVTCSRCGESIKISDQQTEPASAFDDEGSH